MVQPNSVCRCVRLIFGANRLAALSAHSFGLYVCFPHSTSATKYECEWSECNELWYVWNARTSIQRPTSIICTLHCLYLAIFYWICVHAHFFVCVSFYYYDLFFLDPRTEYMRIEHSLDCTILFDINARTHEPTAQRVVRNANATTNRLRATARRLHVVRCLFVRTISCLQTNTRHMQTYIEYTILLNVYTN